MKPRTNSRNSNWKQFCQQLGEGDGVDPRLAARQSSGSRRREDDRKTQQFCQQVAHVLEAVLTGEARDADLQDLNVASVVPAPHAGRLLVTVQSWAEDALSRWSVIDEKLRRAAPWLRSELAASISRRRIPELVFQFVGPNAATDSGRDGVPTYGDSGEEVGDA
ncbi:MAG: ribosome-binding factor A [Planctomycetes bacterium]|nr:ribosome-binding factor A [Planctomycetota bacterium]